MHSQAASSHSQAATAKPSQAKPSPSSHTLTTPFPFTAHRYSANRKGLSTALSHHGITTHWFGKSVEAQSESASGADSALADMLLMGGAVEVLVTPGSTFGYVVHGPLLSLLSGGRATLYGGTHTSRELVGPKAGDCTAVRTSEPNFHFLKVRAVCSKAKASKPTPDPLTPSFSLQHAIRGYKSCRQGAAEAIKRGSEIYRRSAMQH